MINPHFRRQNANQKQCPRCNGVVDRDNRRCRSCGGHLVWSGDNALMVRLLGRKEAWYKWDSNLGGWVYQDYYL
jgi:hypothetical protein